LSESNERTHTNRWWLGRNAERVFDFLNDHPVVKLLALFWVAGISVFVPYNSWYRYSEEAWRAGWEYEPSVRLQLGADGVCQFTNSGSRAIAEVTLEWKQYAVNPTQCRPPLTLFNAIAAAGAHELKPREKLETTFTDEDRARTCHNVSAITAACPPGHDCHIVVECEVLYHRAADLHPYNESQFVFLENKCTSIVPLKRFVVIKGGQQLEWKDERHRNAWRCFNRERARLKPPLEQFDDFDAMFDRLLMQEK